MRPSAGGSRHARTIPRISGKTNNGFTLRKVRIEKDAAFDVAIITDAGADDLIKQGKLAARTALARSAIAVAIKKGAFSIFLS